MLAIINGNADASAEGLEKVQAQLTAIINSNNTENTKEREKLLEQMNALTDNTASYMNDYEKRIKNIENRTTNGVGSTGSHEFQYDWRNGDDGYVDKDGHFNSF